jgi:hypothetical protein
MSFAVIKIVGLNPSKARTRDIVMRVSHNGLETWAQVWMKMCNGNRAWLSVVKFQGRTYFSHFFYSSIVPIFEDKDSFICNGDI